MGTFAVNGLFIAVAAVIVLFMVVGLFRGFIKSVLSLCSFIIAIVATIILAPLVTDHLCSNAAVMNWISGIMSKAGSEIGYRLISEKIIGAIVYVGLYIVLRLILWIICLIISFVRELPGVKGTDMVLGALLGLVRALLLIGIFFFGLSILYEFGIGSDMMDMIEENFILSAMYKYNAVGILINTVLRGV